MTQDPKALQAILAGAGPPDLELAFRSMFGGVMGYAGGKVFASLSDVGLALKLAGPDREALLSVPGAKALQYEPDQPVSKSYVVVPQAMLADRDALRSWVVCSVRGVSSAGAPARGKTR